MEKIFVTGAAGFIGEALCKSLLEEGYTVFGLDNLNEYYDVALKRMRLAELKKYKNFKFFQADLTDMEFLEGLFKDEGFDIVVNLAAQAGVRYSIENPRAYVDSNIVGFFNVLECCRRHMVNRFIYASSSSVYGDGLRVPYSETDMVDKPVSLYAATKKSNELMAYTYSHLYGISCTGLRFFTVYGPMGRPDMAYFSFAEKIINNVPIKIFNNGDMYRDFTYIDDIIEGLKRIVKKNPKSDDVKYKIYNIGNGKPEKLLYMVECLEDALGKKSIKEFYPMQPGDVYQTCADVAALQEEFGYRPGTPLRDGIGRFVEWFKYYKNL